MLAASRGPGQGRLVMSGVLYTHRLSKLLDETVRELGLTVTLSDQTSTVKLAKSIEHLKMITAQLGIEMKIQPGVDFTSIQFSKK
jgi:hypothetical protein